MNSIYFAAVRGLTAMQLRFHGRIQSERGAAAVEYGLLVGLIAAVIVVAVALLGTNLTHIFNGTNSSICGHISSANPAVACTSAG